MTPIANAVSVHAASATQADRTGWIERSVVVARAEDRWMYQETSTLNATGADRDRDREWDELGDGPRARPKPWVHVYRKVSALELPREQRRAGERSDQRGDRLKKAECHPDAGRGTNSRSCPRTWLQIFELAGRQPVTAL